MVDIGEVNVRFEYYNNISSIPKNIKQSYQCKQNNNGTKETSSLDIAIVYPSPILIDDLVVEI